MSTMHEFAAPAATVNCSCMPVSFVLSASLIGLPPVGAPVPVNGNMTVVGVAVTVTGAWGAYEPAGPDAFMSPPPTAEWALSLVEYWTVQPVPPTVPLILKRMPWYAEASTQKVPSGLPLK